jgi:hypothetical protein
MRPLARVTLAAVVGYVTIGFMYLIPGTRLQRIGFPSWAVLLLSLGLSVLMGRYVWRSLPAEDKASIPAATTRNEAVMAGANGARRSLRGADEPRGAMLVWAVALGAIGFAGGFFGPMVFAPGANQGPLLGIFITGPLGTAIGAAVGWFWWVTYKGPNNGGNAG